MGSIPGRNTFASQPEFDSELPTATFQVVLPPCPPPKADGVRLVVLRHGRGHKGGARFRVVRRLLGGLDDGSGSGIVRALLAAWAFFLHAVCRALCSGEAPGVLAAAATARDAGEAVVGGSLGRGQSEGGRGEKHRRALRRREREEAERQVRPL